MATLEIKQDTTFPELLQLIQNIEVPPSTKIRVIIEEIKESKMSNEMKDLFDFKPFKGKNKKTATQIIRDERDNI